jgi:predicted nucleic acid-binding protein
MTTVAVDTSVLLSIFKGESAGERWLDRLQSVAESATLVLSSIALAEVRSFFPTDDACRKALDALDVRFSPLQEPAANLAGKIFRLYREQGGPRTTILPDFLIAAHAATQADALATEDRGYLRTYYPKIRLLELASDP